MRILVVRALRDAERTAARLAAAGHEAVVAPAIEVRPLPYAVPDGPFQALIATSAHAFAACAGLERLQQVPLHVVGARTAAAGRAAGFGRPASVAPNASALVDSLEAIFPSRARFLYLAGRDRRPEIETRLSRRHDVSVVETYAAEPRDVLADEALAGIAQGRIDAVIHYSRRSAEILLELVRKAGIEAELGRLRHFAISAEAAEPLAAIIQSVVVAARPDEDSLLEALAGAPRDHAQEGTRETCPRRS